MYIQFTGDSKSRKLNANGSRQTVHVSTVQKIPCKSHIAYFSAYIV